MFNKILLISLILIYSNSSIADANTSISVAINSLPKNTIIEVKEDIVFKPNKTQVIIGEKKIPYHRLIKKGILGLEKGKDGKIINGRDIEPIYDDTATDHKYITVYIHAKTKSSKLRTLRRGSKLIIDKFETISNSMYIFVKHRSIDYIYITRHDLSDTQMKKIANKAEKDNYKKYNNYSNITINDFKNDILGYSLDFSFPDSTEEDM